jgi:hypothetical protein
MKPFEYVFAALLAVVAIPVVMWSYSHWMTVTSQGPAGPTIAVTGSPSVTAQKIDAILCKAQSPACGTGTQLYQYGVQYGVDPGFGLAVFKHESNYGTAGVARQTLSLGNIRCTPGYACIGGYRAYGSWQAGYSDFYRLISGPVYVGAGLTTPEQIFAKYAPSGDGNNPIQYSADVEQSIAIWRAAA